jgi:hypothetical protein
VRYDAFGSTHGRDEQRVLAELPHAERMAPSTGSDIPTTVPFVMKSRREILPAANSSMT